MMEADSGLSGSNGPVAEDPAADTVEGPREWDYRAVRFEHADGRVQHLLCTVFFNPDGSPDWYAPLDPIETWSDNSETDPAEALQKHLCELMAACLLPILDASSMRNSSEAIDEIR